MILVSDCLYGEPCRYDGKGATCQKLTEGLKNTQVIRVCPEVLGGLETPRSPAEKQSDGSVITKDRKDVTDAFLLGARKTLHIAKDNNVHYAILKSGSPSCGSEMIYDGSFSGEKTKGKGLTADLLEKNKILVYTEKNAPYKKLAVYDFLDSHGISYIKHVHKPVFTVSEVEEYDIKFEGTHCKNLFLKNRKGSKHYLVILEQKEEISLKTIAACIGEKKLSFASEESLNKYLGVTPGSVGFFGLINDREKAVEVILGKELDHHERITFHPNDNDETLGIYYEDFERLLQIFNRKIHYLGE